MDLARGPYEDQILDEMADLRLVQLSRLLPHLDASRLPRHGKRWNEESRSLQAPARSAKQSRLSTSPHAPTIGTRHFARGTANAEDSDAVIITASTAIAQQPRRATADHSDITLFPTARFPCPYLVQTPQSHFQCHRLNLPTPSSVIRHLTAHHCRPPYCPVCGQTFPSHAACDRHIVERACTLAAVPPVAGGLTEEQVDRLLDLEDSFLRLELPELQRRHQRVECGAELERYGAIWKEVFPGTAMPDWAEGPGRVVGCYVHDEGRGSREEGENRTVEVLERMVEGLVGREVASE